MPGSIQTVKVSLLYQSLSDSSQLSTSLDMALIFEEQNAIRTDRSIMGLMSCKDLPGGPAL